MLAVMQLPFTVLFLLIILALISHFSCHCTALGYWLIRQNIGCLPDGVCWMESTTHTIYVPSFSSYLFSGPDVACDCQHWRACWVPPLSGTSALCGWSAHFHQTGQCGVLVCSDLTWKPTGPQKPLTTSILREKDGILDGNLGNCPHWCWNRYEIYCRKPPVTFISRVFTPMFPKSQSHYLPFPLLLHFQALA